MQTQYLWLQMFGLGMISSPVKLRCNNRFITAKVLSTETCVFNDHEANT